MQNTEKGENFTIHQHALYSPSISLNLRVVASPLVLYDIFFSHSSSAAHLQTVRMYHHLHTSARKESELSTSKPIYDVQPEDSASNAGSKSRVRSKSSNTRSRSVAGSSTTSLKAIAATKKVALAAKAAAFHKQKPLQEEELCLKQEEMEYKQRQEEAKLRLNQRKQELHLQTEIAKVEAQEQAYAVAELGDQVSQSPLFFLSQEPAPPTSALASQLPVPTSLSSREVGQTLPTPVIYAPSHPSNERVELSPKAPAWSPSSPSVAHKPLLAKTDLHRQRKSSQSDSSVGERFIQDMIDKQDSNNSTTNGSCICNSPVINSYNNYWGNTISSP